MSITNIKRNCMGTVSFDARFIGMRKDQEFDVYPIGQGESPTRIKVQSDTRIGYIDLTTGNVHLSASIKGGAQIRHLVATVGLETLDAEDLFNLKAHILGSANGMAGTNGVMYTDNSGALEVFTAQPQN
ncbi:hypothetical protein LP417_35635 (plasmid) [Polaromonas sp. P1-6]|nr:hypothetical protein LP417_35635 [Polaromonas sp. P1-6]